MVLAVVVVVQVNAEFVKEKEQYNVFVVMDRVLYMMQMVHLIIVQDVMVLEMQNAIFVTEEVIVLLVKELVKTRILNSLSFQFLAKIIQRNRDLLDHFAKRFELFGCKFFSDFFL